MCGSFLPRQRPHTTSSTSVAGVATPITGAPATAPLLPPVSIAPPHSAQKRASPGFCAPHRVHWISLSAGFGAKLNGGACGRGRGASAPASATRARGGVATAADAGACRRLPQSWQNLRSPGLSRPQRSHFTERKRTAHGEPSQEQYLPARQRVPDLQDQLQKSPVRNAEAQIAVRPALAGRIRPAPEEKWAISRGDADHRRSAEL